MRRGIVVVALVAIGLGTGMSACGSKGDDSRRALLASWGEHVILPGYRDFEAKAAALRDAGNALCQAPSSETLQAARSSWSDARAPWKRAEVFAFGPFKEEPLRLGPKIDFWPVRIDTVELVLAGAEPIAGDTLGAAQKGMPVIEYLLFQPDVDLVAGFSGNSRRCEYLAATTADLAVRAREMREAWDPDQGNYLAELVDAGSDDSMFESVHLALSEVVNRMAFTVENIRMDKLSRPLGDLTGGSPQPDKAESHLSGRSIEDIRDNLRGIELLYFGDGSAESIGLDAYARERGHDFAQAMQDELAAARAALDGIPEPLTRAILDDPDSVSQTIERLADLQRLIQVDILNALSLTPSFNDNDGD